MKLKQEMNKKYYILYIHHYFYNIEGSSYIQPIQPIMVGKYMTIAESQNGKEFKDVIFKNLKYNLDLSVSFGQIRETIYLKKIDNINENMSKREYLEYLKKYIESNKEELKEILKTEEPIQTQTMNYYKKRRIF